MSRRAIAFLGMQQIARMLALPEGLRAIACRDDFHRNGVAVLVEGESLEDQPDAVVLPDLPMSMLEPSALALRSGVLADWRNDGTAELSATCPAGPPCTWTWDTERYDVTLALLVDTVWQHLMDKHAGEATS